MNPTDPGNPQAEEQFERDMLALKAEMLAQLEALQDNEDHQHYIEDNTTLER